VRQLNILVNVVSLLNSTNIYLRNQSFEVGQLSGSASNFECHGSTFPVMEQLLGSWSKTKFQWANFHTMEQN